MTRSGSPYHQKRHQTRFLKLGLMPFSFVLGDIIQLALPASFLKKGLGRHGFWLAGKGFLVEEADGQAVAGVLGSLACIVGLDAFFDISGVARIERSIRTL